MISWIVLLLSMSMVSGEASGRNLLIANPVCDRADEACLTAHAPELCWQLKLQQAECRSLVAWNAKGDELAPEPFEGAIDITVSVRFAGEGVTDRTVRSYTVWGACGDPSLFAYRGESDEGFSLIETSEGLAELLSPDLQIGYERARVLIDASTGEVLSELTAPHDAEASYGFYFKDAEEVFFFTREKCITAPGKGRGRIKVAGPDCDLRRVLQDASVEGSKIINDVGLSQPEPGDVAIAGETEPWASDYFGDEFVKRVNRITGTDVIVVDLLEACT